MRKSTSNLTRKEITLENNDEDSMQSDKDEDRTMYKRDTSLLITQLGYINVTSISKDDQNVSGILDQSPKIKFDSGEFFKNVTRKGSPTITKKLKQIHYDPGFISTTSWKLFRVINIPANEIRCASADNINDIHNESFQMSTHTCLLSWFISESVSISSLSNIKHSFGESLMPSNMHMIRQIYNKSIISTSN